MFDGALDRTPDARRSFLERACGSDAALRREVEALLDLHEMPGEFLDWPAAPPADSAAAPPAAWLDPATLVDGKYRIEGPLGSGGMGAVYRATQLQLERPVALKVMLGGRLSDRETAERFRREAVAVASLRHPNIVTVYDYGVAPDLGAYLVMELLEGRSLRAELSARGRLSPEGAAAVMGPVCEGVAAAHRAGVVHRDLKPENILLEEREGAASVKVLDFGLAKLEATILSPREAPTLAGAVFGTPAYMSPEQCRGEEADRRSDVYALGCVHYEMLTGRPPIGGRSPVATMYNHVHVAPRPPGEIVPGLPPPLERAVLRALAKSPGDRFQTVEELGRALGVMRPPQGADTVPPGGGTPGAETIGGGKVTADIDGGGTLPRSRDNLPRAISAFVGREREIGEVLGRLADARLVTLAGPGGIGKTRLAIEAAARARGEFGDGVWLVELAAVTEPGLAAQAVASALGAREEAGRPVADTLAPWLGDKTLLLVLDNCEHLVDACAGLAASLLEACPGLHVLATSREPLGVAGEAVWPVPALAVPGDGATLEATLASEAARMFVDRAALRKPGFAMTAAVAPVVGAICRRLEGIPLAIELAAARVSVLSAEEILRRLDDQFRLLAGGNRASATRQQTLRATVDWSYDLLTDEERALFRRLSVFAGGWTLEAAEAVARCELGVASPGSPPATPSELATRNSQLATPGVLDLLARLVDKSLVTAEDRGRGTRYGMLEMIREYGLERLAGSGEGTEARRLHAEFFLDVAASADDAPTAGLALAWLERLGDEDGNVRAALAWLVERDPERCLTLAVSLFEFFVYRGRLSEARAWFDGAFERGRTAPVLLQARSLCTAAFAAMVQGDLAAARAYGERGLPIAKASGSWRIVGTTLCILGNVAAMAGDAVVARARFAEGLAGSREAGDDHVVAQALNGLGELARQLGDLGAARGYYEEALALARERPNEPLSNVCINLCNLGAVLCECGDLDAACGCYREALEAAVRIGSLEFGGLCLDGLAAAAAARGEATRAARLAGGAETLREAVGVRLAPVDFAFRERYLAAARARLGDAELEAALAGGRAATPEQAIAEALAGASIERGR